MSSSDAASNHAEGPSRFSSEERRFRDGWSTRLAVGLIAAVGLHFVLFQYFPEIHASRMGEVASTMEAVDLPPPVEIPSPPQQIARPATPQVSADADVNEDVTIAPTTFESNPVEELPPPRSGGGEAGDRPEFIPYDVPPKLLNPSEVQRFLQRVYPKTLKEAGIGGQVVLWMHVSEAGDVEETRVHESSGYAALDDAARKVANHMRFKPALNRDKRTAVWVQQAIRFEVV